MGRPDKKKTTAPEPAKSVVKRFLSQVGSNPRPNEIECGSRTVDRIVRGRTFEPFERPTIGEEIFYFRQRGDSLEGFLIGGPIENFHRSSSYPVKLDDGRVVEFFANKLLHRIIHKNELIGARVRIVFIGKQFTGNSHARKIYRVYKITGAITQTQQEQCA